MGLLTRLFALVLLTLLPIVAVEIYDEVDAQSQRSEEGRDQALRLVRLVAQEQSKVVAGARQLLTALGKTPTLNSGESAACDAYLADLASAYPQYLGFVTIDPTGRTVCTSGAIAPKTFLGDRPYFNLAMRRLGFVLGEYEPGDATRQRAIYLAQPFHDATGKVIGVVAAGLSLDWLNGEIARTPLPPSSTVSVLDRQGTIVARHPASEKFVGTRITDEMHSHLLSGREGVQEALGFDGVSRVYSYAPLPGGTPGLTLSVGLDKNQLFERAQAANRRDTLVIAGSLVLALLCAAFGARAFIGRPIRVLLATADHWRQGDLNVRVPFPEAKSEFGRLGAAFNVMAAAIGIREQELEQRVRERTIAQQAAEAALFEAQKMETVGRLTGGVAHDFNNLLAAIVGNIELARSRLQTSHAAFPRLEAAMQSAKRGAVLVQQLLAFARRQNLRPEVVDLNGYLRASQEMLQRLLRSDVAVEIAVAHNAWPVRVDPNQREAAILNLAVNARDAMPNGGTLRLATKNAILAGEPVEGGLTGDFVALTVADNGTGIAPDILEKVFEPFFTTKDIGEGSGLGLSMVQGFVRQSAGSVRIDSVVGKGTSVTLYLPRSVAAAGHTFVESEDPIGGTGTVLLVDDDPEVRSVTAQLLEMSGYTVIAASNSPEAIACFQRYGRKIDVLVTDLVLANGLNGLELMSALLAERPTLPVLLITGYSEALTRSAESGSAPVLIKPFDHATLARAIQRAIRTAGHNVSRHARVEAL